MFALIWQYLKLFCRIHENFKGKQTLAASSVFGFSLPKAFEIVESLLYVNVRLIRFLYCWPIIAPADLKDFK